MESWKAVEQSGQSTEAAIVRQFDERRVRWKKSSMKEDAHARNVRQDAKCCVFSMIRGSGQSKSRPVKAAGAEVSVLERKQKLHAAVAKRTFASENRKKQTVSEHFLKFRCRKIARRCGETHICKSKCTKHLMFGALFEAQMSKNCTPLWRNVHLQVKILKNWRSRSTFWSSDVQKLHAAVAKRTFASENLKKLTVSEHFLKFRCRKIAPRCGETHICKWKCTKYLCFRTLFEVQMSKISQLINQLIN